MKRVLFDDGVKVGEVEDWAQRSDPPTYKTFLGKTALLAPANNECTFVSPKPVKRKSKLTVIEDGKLKYELQVVQLVGGTEVTAKILKTSQV
ncbi:MAG: hypothetical protein EOP05_13705 [Proteobacteria bacterium]|nr:MAG: hypothetical protein EOP05_13705 [Pseudomonadota bacterium]